MINKTWDPILEKEFKSDYFKKLGIFVKNEYKHKIVYPEYAHIFDCLRYTDYSDVKVVIIGQDPYHGESEAHGLCFSVRDGVPRPPSLNNIFKELYNDLGITKNDNDLTSWARQGVLLLNSIMTVVKDHPLSHKDKGWEIFTDNIITNKNHLIIESVHPSPLSANRGFFGSKPFSKINNFLISQNMEPIDWSDGKKAIEK